MNGKNASKYAQSLLKQFDLYFHIKVPVDRHHTKKNSRPIFRNKATGKTFLGKDQKLILAETHLIQQFRKKAKDIELLDPIEEPIWVCMFFHFTKDKFYTKKGTMRKTIGDLSNLYQLPEDCLTKSGIIADDCLIMSHDFSRRLPSDENALELFIMKYTSEGMAQAVAEEITPLTASLNLSEFDYNFN